MSQSDLSPDHPDEGHKQQDVDPGLAGRTAKSFIRSPLSPLFYVAMLLMGVMGLVISSVLALASKIFYVYVDPKIEAVEGELPGAN